MKKIWSSIEEIFNALNKASINYVVLRNFEALDNNGIFIEGHEDIDLLCDNIIMIKKVLGTRKIYKFPGRNSYTINFQNTKLQIDIRYIGDGYYDTKWEKEILNRKKLFKDYIYVIDNEMYFYTLIYHAIYQKTFLSNEYFVKLQNMGLQLGLKINSEKQLKKILFQFMKYNKYRFTYTSDPGIILNFPTSHNSMIKRNLIRQGKRKLLKYFQRCPRRKIYGKLHNLN